MAVFTGSKVFMADGSTKNVEDIVVGDQVIDYMNTVQTIEGVRNRRNLYHLSHLSEERRSLVPEIPRNKIAPWMKVVKINDELLITESHSLFSTDGFIYSVNEYNGLSINDRAPLTVSYIFSNNSIKGVWVWGLGENSVMLRELKVGVELQTINGSKIVESIEEVDKDSLQDLELFNHSVTNSGTYFVNGYCVGARINEFWDYKNKKLYDQPFDIIHDTDMETHHPYSPDRFKKVFNLDKTTNKFPVWDHEIGDWK